jgi:hypothetical protein
MADLGGTRRRSRLQTAFYLALLAGAAAFGGGAALTKDWLLGPRAEAWEERYGAVAATVGCGDPPVTVYRGAGDAWLAALVVALAAAAVACAVQAVVLSRGLTWAFRGLGVLALAAALVWLNVMVHDLPGLFVEILRARLPTSCPLGDG